MQRQNRTFSLSILSGKGGVGKTNIALNLAYALYQAGQNTLLVDCDLGLANLDVMLGIAPEGSLHDILNHNAKVEDILFNLGKNGLDLIPAASGVTDILDLDEDQQDNVVQRLTKVMSKYNFLLLDLGAGINQTVQSFAAMTHHQVVVITPEPTSLTDGYALIKVLYTQKFIYWLIWFIQSRRDDLVLNGSGLPVKSFWNSRSIFWDLSARTMLCLSPFECKNLFFRLQPTLTRPGMS